MCKGAGDDRGQKKFLDAAKITSAAITFTVLLGLNAGSVPLPAAFPGGEMLARSFEQTKLQPAIAAELLQGNSPLCT